MYSDATMQDPKFPFENVEGAYGFQPNVRKKKHFKENPNTKIGKTNG